MMMMMMMMITADTIIAYVTHDHHRPSRLYHHRQAGAERIDVAAEADYSRAYSKEFFVVHNYKSSCMM